MDFRPCVLSVFILFNNPTWLIDLPVVVVSQAATCLELYCFKCFLAFSNASSSVGIGCKRAGSSSSCLYPNGIVFLIFGIGTYVSFALGWGNIQAPKSLSFTAVFGW